MKSIIGEKISPFVWILLFFLLLFIQFPLNDSFPGNTDTYAAISFSNQYILKLKSFFSGADYGQSLYPFKNIFSSGETAIGTSLFFIMFKCLGLNDLMSYYFFISLLFSLSAYSASSFFSNFFVSKRIHFLLGLSFCTTNFIFGNIDSPHTIFFFFFFLSIHHCYGYINEKKKKRLFFSTVFCSLQAYFSIYVFLMTATTLFIILVSHLKDFSPLFKKERKFLVGNMALLAFLLFPFFNQYILKGLKQDVTNPWNYKPISELHSFNPEDLLRKLPGNLYNWKGDIPIVEEGLEELKLYKKYGFEEYSGEFIKKDHPLIPKDSKFHFNILALTSPLDKDSNKLNFPFLRRCGFLGVTLYICSFFGIFVSGKRLRIFSFFLIFSGLFLSFGPLIKVSNVVFPNFLYPLYQNIELMSYVRIPSRFFLLYQLGLFLFAGKFFEFLLIKKGKLDLPKIIVPFLFFFIVLENIPFSFLKFKNFMNPPKSYGEFFKDKKDSIVLNLPSNLGLYFFGENENFFSYSRESIYMNWQTYLENNIVNGTHGYIPKTRLNLQTMINKIHQEKEVDRLKKNFNVNYIVFFKKMILSESESLILEKSLKPNSKMTLSFENDELAIFNI
jgi:hypothetical protein